MYIKLNRGEQLFLDEVRKGLVINQVDKYDVQIVEQQILEHIQESREEGRDALHELGDPREFIKDFMDVQGIASFASDTRTEQPEIRRHSVASKIKHAGTAVITFAALFLVSQFLLSMFLTDSFVSETFNYNLTYNIAENNWWNAILIMISIITAISSSMLTLKIAANRLSRGAK